MSFVLNGIFTCWFAWYWGIARSINPACNPPSFSEKKLGHSTFKDFIESLKGDIIKKIEFVKDKNHHLVYFTNVELKIKEQKNQKEETQQFLNKSLKYLKRSSKRSKLCKILFDGF